MSDNPSGGDCVPVILSTDPPMSGPAMRVYGYRTVAAAMADGKVILGNDDSLPVYIISAAEVDTIGVQGNTPLPVIIPPDGRPANGSPAPVPVYVVNPIDWP